MGHRSNQKKQKLCPFVAFSILRSARASPHELMLAGLWTDRRAQMCALGMRSVRHSSAQTLEHTTFTANGVSGDSICVRNTLLQGLSL